MARLVACLVELRAEFDRVAPSRSTGSDGWIGDAAHQKRKSDHNPDSRSLVHAIDVTTGLNESDLSMEKCVQLLVARCRSGAEKRLTYIIFRRRIWSASAGWKQRTYTGDDPHENHAHFSASHEPGHENSQAPWHLEDIPVALTQADKQWLTSMVASFVGDVSPRWTNEGTKVPDSDPNPTETVAAGVFYVGATARRCENALARIEEKLATPPATGAKSSRPAPPPAG